MPFIQIALSSNPDTDLAARVAREVGGLTHKVLRKDPAVTAIAVQFIPPDQWFVAGKSLAARGRTAFWLDIKITEGTNTKEETGAYVAAIFNAMGALLGSLEEESYVLVDGVPAYAYGYGARTQERRFIEARINA